ncbi:MAG: pirin family protein [Thermoanaerobaculia bacterium]
MNHDDVAAERCESLRGEGDEMIAFPPREAKLGPLTIWRALPVRERRLVGPWCFLDRYGPVSFTEGRAMDVAEHPHIGLQTVSWLFDGEVLHLDSLGSEATARPGGVNVMTSGSGIAHVELTPEGHSGRLDGVQLWVALPDIHKDVNPSFHHLAEVPVTELRGGRVQTFFGSFGDVQSPALRFGDAVGADVACRAGEEIVLPLARGWEHALLPVAGAAHVEGQRLAVNTLYYLGTERSELAIRATEDSRLLLLGGPPFETPILMWWNFVARNPEEIAEARKLWEASDHFGAVKGYEGPRIEAPPLNRLARPNPAS